MWNKKNSVPCLLLLSCSPVLCQENKPVSETPDDRVNYPSNFQVEEGCNLFLFGEYLFWNASEGGLYFAQTGLGNPTGTIPPDGSIDFDGKIKRIDFKCNSGARIGAGLNFPKEGYEVAFYWTWFSTDGHASAHADNGSLLPLFAEPDFNPPVGAVRASGKANIDLNIFDLEWGRSSWFGGHFSLRPFFGLRAAWIEQSLKTQFTYATAPIVLGRLHSAADFCGGGLRAGADARFTLPLGFALYSIASGSLLYGQLNDGLHIKEDGTTIAHTKDRFSKAISSLQLGLGIGWDTHFAKDRLHLEFHIGWESNIWFSVNQINHFMNQLHEGSYFKENNNLATQGIVAGSRFDF
jgi:hypothetical protein